MTGSPCRPTRPVAAHEHDQEPTVAFFAHADGHEQVVLTRDEATGLACIIAIHSTRLGPALGGTRWRPYASEDEAMTDVLRLSRAMTYKNACAGIDHGGGKAVIIGDPGTDRSEALLRAYGRAIASLGGRYVTAGDVGTTPADLAVIKRETPFVTGAESSDGGSGDSGVTTALGVELGMRAAAAFRWGSDDLGSRHVAVQGLGKVGGRLVRSLADQGAKLTVADVDQAAVDRVADLPGVEVVDVDDVLFVDADIISPNALGGVLSATTIPEVQAAVVCGGANNQLATDEDAEALRDADVLYCPDFVVNAGGVIQVADELLPGGHDPDRVRRRAQAIPATLTTVLEVARDERVSTEVAAERVAERRIAGVGALRGFYLPGR
ncbi:Glu/Leu/Phe/Val dehydrogenase [Nitriliruptoraceae bacterium ZYF776]|nr:Glu/Leu/Phe/Val dehydrogenase [Profundirhabdus halotolerans]